jgi:16S rRNA processing protein RimM
MAVVARVARPHGLRGELVLNPETDFPEERFRPGNTVYAMRAGVVGALVIRSSWMQRERPVVAFEGFDAIESVEPLAGLELRVSADSLMPLPAGSYYRHELVGCVVETVGAIRVGPVVRVEGDVAASLLIVDGDDGEVLIPLAGGICRLVDIAARRIVIGPPDGLLELNVTRRSLKQKRGGHT